MRCDWYITAARDVEPISARDMLSKSTVRPKNARAIAADSFTHPLAGSSKQAASRNVFVKNAFLNELGIVGACCVSHGTLTVRPPVPPWLKVRIPVG